MTEDFTLEIAQQAAARWRERAEKRASDEQKIEANGIADVETPERISSNLERLTMAVVSQGGTPAATVRAAFDNNSARAKAAVLADISNERIIGDPDFLGMDFLEKGVAVARFTGRVNIRNTGGATVGYGTGSMVSPRLLLTNHHVLENIADARNSLIEFDYQVDQRGRMLPVVTFKLEPDVFFMTDEKLDFTLVAVSKTSNTPAGIEHYGWNRLIETQGKILLHQAVNIVQHPRGEPKQVVLRKNELIDLLPEFAHYTADTEPGSSGALVFNDLWEVVALHHSGVPDTDADGNILTDDKTVWKPGMDPDKIRWVANEGIRVSSLLKDVKEKITDLKGEAKDLCAEMLEKEAPDPLEIKSMVNKSNQDKISVSVPSSSSSTDRTMPANQVTSPSSQTENGEVTWTIPLEVKIKLGAPQIKMQIPGAYQTGQKQQAETQNLFVPPVEEAISIDPDYSNRKGFATDFLGSGSKQQVALPKLSDELSTKAVISNQADGNSEQYVLPYHHFSIVVNKERRLAFFTAVNIDGTQSFRIKRETDKWFYDPRIDKKYQVGEELYAGNALDRGHLVRRLDPAWGANKDLAKVANDDTFHFTNCSPQHSDFNQGKNLWAGLEDYILNNADNKDFKVSVFSGPVFEDDDAEYRDIQLPKQFWKVVVMVKQNGKLSATAYLVSQKDLIENLEEEFIYGEFKTFQVSIEAIEELTKLDFGNLKFFQPAEIEDAPLHEAYKNNELASYEQIKI